jgi:hypothetical protein
LLLGLVFWLLIALRGRSTNPQGGQSP